MLLAGGGAGAVARTCTAPLDRVKLLFQVQHLGQGGTAAGSYTGVGQAMGKIFREEGFLSFWKGNGVNVVRIFPYSASQFMAHEQVKSFLADPDTGALSLPRRLASGAIAGMTGTALTHPLDTVRLRLALPSHGYNGVVDAAKTMVHVEGFGSLFKGLPATLLGIAPYASLNFASYDVLKRFSEDVIGMPATPAGTFGVAPLLLGATSGTFATTACYPLDTIRRRMQMKGDTYKSIYDAMVTIAKAEGLRGYYRGWVANTLKVIPQNSIRFFAYEGFKSLLQIKKRKTDT